MPVSSTVIPLYSYHVNATGATKFHALSLDEEEYRLAYMKHMMKKHKEAQDDPDTLITCKYIPICLKKYNWSIQATIILYFSNQKIPSG